MKSRWTNFLTEDGEKEWRNRDDEFINSFTSKEEVITYWEMGWNCLFEAINSITIKIIKILLFILEIMDIQ